MFPTKVHAPHGKEQGCGQVAARVSNAASACLPVSRKLDVAVVFHASTTVKVKVLNTLLKPFLTNLFLDSEMDDGQVRVSLGYFSKNFKLLGNLLKYKNKAEYTAAVQKLPKNVRGKQSNGGKTMKQIRTKVFKKKLGDRPGAGNVVLLITDDETNVKPQLFAEHAETLRDFGVKIVSLGIGKASEKELQAVATPGRNTFTAAGYDDLAKETLIEELRTAMFTRELSWLTCRFRN